MNKIGLYFGKSKRIKIDVFMKEFEVYLSCYKFLNYKTVDEYTYAVDEFLKIIGYQSISSIFSLKYISGTEYSSYLNHLYQIKNNKAITVAKKISALKKFNIFLYEEYSFEMDIKFVYPKTPKKLINHLSEEKMFRLLDNMEYNNFLKLRNKVLLELLYSSGMRVSELINIKLTDIHLNNNQINVIGKFNKERIVYYSKTTNEFLSKYLKQIKKINSKIDSNRYLFLSINNKKLSGVAINQIISKECIKNNIQVVTAHIFRHSFASHLLLNGADIKTISILLGHSSITTTQRYTHIDIRELSSEYNKIINKVLTKQFFSVTITLLISSDFLNYYKFYIKSGDLLNFFCQYITSHNIYYVN